jgi:tetratricopeptide (TPR) repeat protein
MKTNLIIILFVASITLNSCNKFLDEKSDKTLVVLNKVEDLQAMLDDATIMNLKTSSFGQVSSDDYFITDESYNSFLENDQESYTWRRKEYNFPNDWASAYNAIYNANYCLETVGIIERTNENSSKWDNVKGSALFYRGYYFLTMLWEHAMAYKDENAKNKNGIVLRLTSNFNNPSKRSTIKESYDQVVDDFRDAISFLPDIPIHVMRPSKAACYGALARTFLSMGQFDSANKYAILCLQLKNDLIDYNKIELNSPSPFSRFNSETIFYSAQSGVYTAMTPNYALIDTALYNSYSVNDLRKKCFFIKNGDHWSFKGQYSGSPTIFFSGITTAEMYLIASECLARMGKLNESANYLNQLLKNRIESAGFTTVMLSEFTVQSAIDYVLEERRKELLMRGLRWIDIKRLLITGEVSNPKRIVGQNVYELKQGDKYLALPIPSDVVRISGIEQN